MSGASAKTAEPLFKKLFILQVGWPEVVHIVAEGFLTAIEKNLQWANTFQTLACITYAIIALAKASHRAKPS